MNMLHYRSVSLWLLTLLVSFCVLTGFSEGESERVVVDSTDSWILKWASNTPPELDDRTEAIRVYPELEVTLIRPLAPVDQVEWLDYWIDHPDALYIQPNQRFRISMQPNDTLLHTQSYLNTIGMPAAWDRATGNTDITIGLVDTGVDLDHGDLVDNLIPGINLLNHSAPPQDDNGHGTNVAGVIAATGNNGRGVSGVLWNAKIMPIKAIGAEGSGDEINLGEGIRYAVDQGSRIIVLPLGLYKYSPFLDEIVQYAESKNVLLVAASGNDGQSVKYPAAYPTVLAVGGVDEKKRVMQQSNRGQELDLVAPWSVYTTALDGSYTSVGGTSMAAPQVAGAAALIWSLYPNFKAYQVRNLLRQTAEDIDAPGWDERSGYGLLRVDQALSVQPKNDIYEPNNQLSAAKQLPIGKMITAELEAGDRDAFFYTSRYRGEISLRFQAITGGDVSRMKLVFYPDSSAAGVEYNDLSKPIRLPSTTGKHFIMIQPKDGQLSVPIAYRLTSQFHIAPDPFEDNDRQFLAYSLPVRSQSVVGNFHKINDIDWFVLNVEHPGTLRVTVSTDSFRIDPALLILRQGEAEKPPIDTYKWGETEYSPSIEVLPGKYYIRVTNAISDVSYPVDGEYTLNISYTQRISDSNEPNDRATQATRISTGTAYQGVIFPKEDQDWFSLRLQNDRLVSIKLENIPANRKMTLTLLDHAQKSVASETHTLGSTSMQLDQLLKSGTYYIRLTADEAFQSQMYKLSVTEEALVQGFRDIGSHWAKDAIVNLAKRGVVSGYSDYRFRPNQEVTRAEAVAMLSNAVTLQAKGSYIGYSDVASTHWAYAAIRQASRARVVSGYPDGKFQPGTSLNRVEMAVLIANVLDVKGVSRRSAPFTDVTSDHWAAPVLRQMKAEGWVSGYDGGFFRPQQKATRAEFVTMLARILDR